MPATDVKMNAKTTQTKDIASIPAIGLMDYVKNLAMANGIVFTGSPRLQNHAMNGTWQPGQEGAGNPARRVLATRSCRVLGNPARRAMGFFPQKPEVTYGRKR
jgi:hypothetical protein